MDEGFYTSSEELQRTHAASVFAANSEKKKTKSTETQKVLKVLDKHIGRHSSTVEIRKMIKDNGKSAEHQLDVSADLVVILEKIKSELG